MADENGLVARQRRLLAARAPLRRRASSARGAAGTWIQVNCSLFAQASQASAYVPWAELGTVLDTWRSEGRFEQFFFMRKSPALRLRFRASDPTARLEPVLIAWLEDAEQRNLIRSFRFATYEPEVFLFGGPTGMAVAHHQFDRDSRFVIEYEALTERSAISLSRARLTLPVMHDLFRRFAEDESELWDIWQRLWRRHGCPPLPAGERVTVIDDSDVPPALLATARLNNEHVARRLHAAEVLRRLERGPRTWLADVCTFHWNRLGLPLEERLSLIASMLHSLDPHREPQ